MINDIVIVTDSLSIDGGSAKVALGSALALANRGFRVTIFAAGGKASPDLLEHSNIRMISTGQGDALSSSNRFAGALNGLWNQLAFRKMQALLKTLDRRTTIVHAHGWTKALSCSVLASVVTARFPIVLTLHEYFTVCPTGCLYLHRARKVCTIKPMSLACIRTNCDSRNYAFKLYRVVRQWIQGAVAGVPRRVSHFISVSRFSRQVLQALLPQGSTFHEVDNPVDADRQPRILAEQNTSYLFIGRLSAEKGGALLADAARRADVSAVFIGEGAERSEIGRINPKVRFTGWLDRTAVTEQLRNARCVVVPSLWYETLGLVVLEAAALGIPAIVPTGTAAFDLIEAGLTGLSFERGDVDDLARQLKKCADDVTVRDLSEAAYSAFWRNPPTMNAHVDRLLTTYEEILGVPAAMPQLAASI